MNINSNDIGFTCDVCGRTIQGTTIVNGMKFCAKCYQETFGKSEIVVSWAKDNPFEKLKQENKTKDERIAQLEMRIKELQDDNRNLRKGLNKEGLDYFITQTNNIRHEICEKIREKVKRGSFNLTVKEYDDETYSKYKKWVFEILNQIEGEDEENE